MSVLHVDLVGYGSRHLAATALDLIGEGLIEDGSDQVICVVRMSQSRGTTIRTLPPIASFIAAHGHRLKPIIVLEARGAALTAVRVIKRLSGLNRRIRCFSSVADFEAECRRGDEAYKQARIVVNSIFWEQDRLSRLQQQGRKQWQRASTRLREAVARLHGGALTCEETA